MSLSVKPKYTYMRDPRAVEINASGHAAAYNEFARTRRLPGRPDPHREVRYLVTFAAITREVNEVGHGTRQVFLGYEVYLNGQYYSAGWDLPTIMENVTRDLAGYEELRRLGYVNGFTMPQPLSRPLPEPLPSRPWAEGDAP